MQQSCQENEVDEVENLAGMLEQDVVSQLEDAKKKATELFLSIIGSVEECDSRHLDALQHLQKSGSAIKSTFDSMKKGSSNVVKMEPIFKSSNKNIDRQRKFFSTTKRRKKGNIRFAKPTDEDRTAFLDSDGFIVSDSKIPKDEKLKGKLRLQ